MSQLRAPILRGVHHGGGTLGYPLDQLHEEVAYLAYHFHWPRDEIMALDHIERQRWVEEVGLINERLNKEAEETY